MTNLDIRNVFMKLKVYLVKLIWNRSGTESLEEEDYYAKTAKDTAKELWRQMKLLAAEKNDPRKKVAWSYFAIAASASGFYNILFMLFSSMIYCILKVWVDDNDDTWSRASIVFKGPTFQIVYFVAHLLFGMANICTVYFAKPYETSFGILCLITHFVHMTAHILVVTSYSFLLQLTVSNGWIGVATNLYLVIMPIVVLAVFLSVNLLQPFPKRVSVILKIADAALKGAISTLSLVSFIVGLYNGGTSVQIPIRVLISIMIHVLMAVTILHASQELGTFGLIGLSINLFVLVHALRNAFSYHNTIVLLQFGYWTREKDFDTLTDEEEDTMAPDTGKGNVPDALAQNVANILAGPKNDDIDLRVQTGTTLNL